MIGDGRGDVVHLVSEHPQTPPQIDILVVGEEVLVKASDIVEDRAVDGHGTAAGEEAAGRHIVLRSWNFLVALLNADAVEVHASPG